MNLKVLDYGQVDQMSISRTDPLVGKCEHNIYSSVTTKPEHMDINPQATNVIYMEHPFLMFLDHTQRRSTVGRTPLDE